MLFMMNMFGMLSNRLFYSTAEFQKEGGLTELLESMFSSFTERENSEKWRNESTKAHVIAGGKFFICFHRAHAQNHKISFVFRLPYNFR